VDCISCSIFSSDSLHHLDSPEPVDMLIVDDALCNPHGGRHAFAICIICMAIMTMSSWKIIECSCIYKVYLVSFLCQIMSNQNGEI
jgi:hypothetical protein